MVYDVLIVGAGPAGITAAIHAGAEGLKALVIEHDTLGGEFKHTSLVENYYGFPEGITGIDLVERGREQALRMGATIVQDTVAEISHNGDEFTIKCTGFGRYVGKTIILANGLKFRELPINNPKVHYGPGDANEFKGKKIAVVGGGNSAGQFVQYASHLGCPIDLYVRNHTLDESMSAYLVERIITDKNVTFYTNTDAWSVKFDLYEASYVFIGMTPDTKFLNGVVQLDDRGYVVCSGIHTSEPGIWCAGAVREGFISRIQIAAGEGAACIAEILHHLQNLKTENHELVGG